MYFESIPEELAFGIDRIKSLLPGKQDYTVKFVKDEQMTVTKNQDGVTVGYRRPLDAFRGITFADRLPMGQTISQRPKFERLCVMIDCSRNAVLNIRSLKTLLTHLAMLGFTSVMLYTEDTYEIPEQPYFGHLRGRFSVSELKEINEFAQKMDLEMIPCIQTLAHLNALTNWKAFSSIIDVNDILLADDERTYTLIDNMLKNMRECFSSRYINIGMDEAHLLGRGKHTDRYGYEEKSSIMLRHLNKVVELCKKYDFEPIMWSDMFFRMQFDGKYRVEEGELREDVIAKIPDEVSLCYWEYYTNPTMEKALDHMFHCHQTTGKKLWFAGGSWSWYGYAPKNSFSMWVTPTQLRYAEKYGVKNIITTCWGDDGGECSIFNMFPSFMQYAEICWSDADDDTLNRRSLDCFGIPFMDWLAIDTVGWYGELPDDVTVPPVYEKAALYGDPMFGPMKWDLDHAVSADKYAIDAERLTDIMAGMTNFRYAFLFDTQRRMAQLLDAKLRFSADLRAAYRAGDKVALRNLRENDLPNVMSLLDEFIRVYRFQWMALNKPFGFEIIDIRLGGLRQRLCTADERLEEYLRGAIQNLEELEQPELPFNGLNAKPYAGSVMWRQAATASVVSMK